MQQNRSAALNLRQLMTTLRMIQVTSSAWKRAVVLTPGVLCLVLSGVCMTATAQTAGSGNIQGVVTDPSGAMIPNADVTLVETSTQVTLKSKTNSKGNYAFPNINVGTYSLRVAAPGFQTYTSTGNVLGTC